MIEYKFKGSTHNGTVEDAPRDELVGSRWDLDGLFLGYTG